MLKCAGLGYSRTTLVTLGLGLLGQKMKKMTKRTIGVKDTLDIVMIACKLIYYTFP